MRVLTVYDRQDSLVLRTKCTGISAGELTSDEYKILADKMVATVTSPEEDGVGIAGPQVGHHATHIGYDEERVTPIRR